MFDEKHTNSIADSDYQSSWTEGWTVSIYPFGLQAPAIFTKTYNASSYNYPQQGESGYNSGYVLNIDDSFVADTTGNTADTRYVIKVVRGGQTTASSISLKEFKYEAPSFTKNQIIGLGAQQSWVDKESGFTIKSGLTVLSGGATTTVTYEDTFTTSYAVTTSSSNTSGSITDRLVVKTAANHTLNNRNYNSATVYWIATGYTAI